MKTTVISNEIVLYNLNNYSMITHYEIQNTIILRLHLFINIHVPTV